jgi:competence protein ComEC
VSALVLGSDARVPNELAAAHRATGLSHLLAVSGAHAAMLSMLLGLQPFAGGRRRRSSKLHLCLAMGLLLVYGAITGLEPPVFRALVSYTIGAIGMRTGRSAGAAAGLAWPALLSCLVAPHGVLGASFCLSYAAVAGLWLAGPPRSEGRVERFVLAPVRASFWATALTAPLTLGWFGQLAPWTVLLTPILAPLVAAILFLGLFTSVGALLIPPLGAVLAPPLAAAATLYVTAVEHANALPATPVFAWCVPSWVSLALAALAGAAAVALLRTRSSVLLGCACAAVPHFLPPPSPEHSILHLFAIGHGQCCLVTMRDGHNVVLDCGSLQYLALPPRRIDSALQRRCIDLLVLTHADRDHTGSVFDLSGRVPIRRAILPMAMEDHPAALALRSQGCSITWLQPGERSEPMPGFLVAAPRNPGAKCNDSSLWTTVELDGLSVQLPGDAQQAGIAAAIEDGIAKRADVLVLPHHGRPEVTIDALLDVVDPRLCLVSNRTGEDVSVQGTQTLRRGVPTFATGMCGSLRLEGGARPNLASTIGLSLPQRPPAK